MTIFSYDRRALLSTLNFRRIWNAFLLTSSYVCSRLLHSVQHAGFPLSVSIEPTTACNLNCPECPSGLKKFERPEGMLESDTFKTFIDQLADRLMYLNLYFQGEPYINPKFLSMVEYAKKKNNYTATSTNAHFITDDIAKKTVLSGLNSLIVSIDGATQEVYAQYRKNGNLYKAVEGLKNIIKWKKELNSKTPHVILQCIIFKNNEEKLGDIITLGKNTGVDEVRFKTAQLYDYKHGHQLLPEKEINARYIKKRDGTYRIKNKLKNHCWRMWTSCVITWDGLVVPCCFDKNAAHKLGSIKNEKFYRIWKNKEYRNFRSAILKSRKSIDICMNCSEGSKIWK